MNRQIFAIGIVHNEADIIGYTILHLLSEGFDAVVVDDHRSDDDTPRILEELSSLYPGRVFVHRIEDCRFMQKQWINRLLCYAYECGAYAVLPFDADELHYNYVDERNVAEVLRNAESDVVGMPVWEHMPSNIDDGDEPNPYRRILWRREERNSIDKIACRCLKGMTIDHGYHRALDHEGIQILGEAVGIGVRHFPVRSLQQFVAKAYRASAVIDTMDMPPESAVHWRRMANISKHGGFDACVATYRKHCLCNPDTIFGTVLDPAPYLRMP